MAKNLNSRKVKKSLNGIRPKTAIPKGQHKKYRMRWNLRKRACLNPRHLSESSNSMNEFCDQTVINNWLYGRSMYVDRSPPHIRRSAMDQEMSMPGTFHDLLKHRLLQESIMKDQAKMDNILNSLTASSIATRELLHDALKFGERHGVVQRVDYGPGEYCWVFTPPSGVFNPRQNLRCPCTMECDEVDNRIHHCAMHDKSPSFDTADTDKAGGPCQESCVSLLERTAKVRFVKEPLQKKQNPNFNDEKH